MTGKEYQDASVKIDGRAYELPMQVRLEGMKGNIIALRVASEDAHANPEVAKELMRTVNSDDRVYELEIDDFQIEGKTVNLIVSGLLERWVGGKNILPRLDMEFAFRSYQVKGAK